MHVAQFMLSVWLGLTAMRLAVEFVIPDTADFDWEALVGFDLAKMLFPVAAIIAGFPNPDIVVASLVALPVGVPIKIGRNRTFDLFRLAGLIAVTALIFYSGRL